MHEKEFSLNHLAEQVHEIAISKGWYKDENEIIDIPKHIALIHSEVSEALEDYRDGNMNIRFKREDNKPVGFPTELADIIIRVLDLSRCLNINIQYALDTKIDYNITRPHRHGGKKI